MTMMTPEQELALFNRFVDRLRKGPGSRGIIRHSDLDGVGIGDGLHGASAAAGSGFTVDGTPIDKDLVAWDQALQVPVWMALAAVVDGVPTVGDVVTYDATGRPTWESIPTPVAFHGVHTINDTDPGQLVNSGSTDVISWLEPQYDTDDFWDGGNDSRLTVPITGYYRLNCKLRFAANGAPQQPWAMFSLLYVNGNALLDFFPEDRMHNQSFTVNSASGPLLEMEESTVLPLEEGDYIEVYAGTQSFNAVGSYIRGEIALQLVG